MSRELKDRLLSLIEALGGRRVMVVGDLVADLYVLSEPARLSREAPVLVARYEGEKLIPGGAANAVNNLLALGAEVVPVGVVGDDALGNSLLDRFSREGVDVSGIVKDPDWVTVSKTRFMVGDPNRMKQQVLRLDRDPEGPPGDRARSAVLERLRRGVGDVDAVLLSDYGYGVADGTVLDTVRGAGGDRVITADSRYRIASFRGVSLATPNEGEVEEALGQSLRTDDELERGGETLRRKIESPALLITRGNRGMALFVEGREREDIPASGSDEVTDVSGAGDTVISVATLALAAGADVTGAAHLANLAAGVVVMKVGAATCSPAELREAVERHA